MNILHRNNLFLLSLIAVTSCATSYRPSGSTSYGYKDKIIQEGIYTVSFHGDENTTKKSVDKMCLLRCAELTLEKGYKYFEIIDEGNLKNNTQMGTAPINATQGVFYNGKYYQKFMLQGQSTLPITISMGKFCQHKIKCFKEKSESSSYLYDATQVKYTR
jgi:hypothetical protein